RDLLRRIAAPDGESTGGERLLGLGSMRGEWLAALFDGTGRWMQAVAPAERATAENLRAFASFCRLLDHCELRHTADDKVQRSVLRPEFFSHLQAVCRPVKNS
ncbi:MAG TPA: hypothetical protein PKX51_16845, partial [Cyclobacteriaceae bacterium]|nr:hypothetical protein [Cyclobacteriaceae bacterium]